MQAIGILASLNQTVKLFQDQVDLGIDTDGSNLTGVTSRCVWEEVPQVESTHFHSDDNKDNRLTNRERRTSVEKGHISSQGKEWKSKGRE